MDVIEAMLSRHSTRFFKSTPVPKDTLIKIVEAANRTPSTANTQPWQLYIAAGAILDKLRQACTDRFQQGVSVNPDIPFFKDWPESMKALLDRNRAERFQMLGIDRQDKIALKENQGLNYLYFGAPAAIFICMERNLGPFSIFDLGAFSLSICLAARHFEVDSIPALNFVGYPDIIRQELQIPDNLKLVMGIALGYEDVKHPVNQYRSSRRPVEDFTHFRGI